MELNYLIEIVGALIGLTYLYLEYHASFWLWIAGMVMSLFYIYIFFEGKFYADMSIYAYYLGANLYGLILWKKHQDRKPEKSDYQGINHLQKNRILPLAAIFVALNFILYMILSRLTDSPVPLGDSFTTALSIIAMWMMAKKNLEHWFLWFIVNAVSTGLYFWKGLYPTACLFIIYTVVSAFGYYKWKQLMLKERS
jgi:nicotinamide mononucleotide transporter